MAIMHTSALSNRFSTKKGQRFAQKDCQTLESGLIFDWQSHSGNYIEIHGVGKCLPVDYVTAKIPLYKPSIVTGWSGDEHEIIPTRYMYFLIDEYDNHLNGEYTSYMEARLAALKRFKGINGYMPTYTPSSYKWGYTGHKQALTHMGVKVGIRIYG